MNYKHVYHAGSFTDVVKHIVTFQLVKFLQRKDAAFCYIDTHAGAGYYDLFSDYAQKSKEYKNGIEKIIEQDKPPAIIKEFLDCIHKINNQLTAAKFAALRFYPGSPLIIRQLLRAHDTMIACELHPEEYQALRNTFAGDKHAAIHHADGFLGLKAFLPPKERRGLVLIDPPYENPDEFTRLARSLPQALKKWETGIYAIWYPIKGMQAVQRFYNTLKDSLPNPMLVIELSIYPDLPQHLNGCGLVIINPPWQFQEELQQLLPWLWKALTINNQGAFNTYLLK